MLMVSRPDRVREIFKLIHIAETWHANSFAIALFSSRWWFSSFLALALEFLDFKVANLLQ